MTELEKLTDTFRKLGADDAEGWARSQITEGINQLGRYVFLKQAWARVIDENDSTWIDCEMRRASQRPDDPYADVGHALSRLKDLGADNTTIRNLVRGIQAELLFSFCSLLDDPGDLPDEVKNISWCLFQIDEHGRPVAALEALHESVLDTDPTGREMRPRETS